MSVDAKDIFVSGVPAALVKALDDVAKSEGCSRAALLIEGARAVLDRRSARPVYKAVRDQDGTWSVAYEDAQGRRNTVVARGMSKKDALCVAGVLGRQG